MSSLDVEIARKKLSTVIYDVDIYGGNKPDGYLHSIPVDDNEEIADEMENKLATKLASYTAPKSSLKEMLNGGADVGDVFRKPQKITDRENEYQRRRLDRVLSPDRNDAFAMGDKTPGANVRTYVEIMREQALKRREEETIRAISKKIKDEDEQSRKKRKNRWDQSDWDLSDSTPRGGIDLLTPTPCQLNLRGPLTRELYNLMKQEKDIENRNMPLSDEELDAMFPTKGYKILECPASYVPIRTPARKLLSTDTPLDLDTPVYQIPVEDRLQKFDVGKEPAANGLPFMKPEDYQYFGVLLNEEFQDRKKTRRVKKSIGKLKRK
ncbi:uncharacterized protein LOC141650351 [Silene latifolia]|uniref:uncharacterized protein LOC141650351 n=1 Tax=Silene latifolia TaxID=37657 RepID=UPI003D77FB8D